MVLYVFFPAHAADVKFLGTRDIRTGSWVVSQPKPSSGLNFSGRLSHRFVATLSLPGPPSE